MTGILYGVQKSKLPSLMLGPQLPLFGRVGNHTARHDWTNHSILLLVKCIYGKIRRSQLRPKLSFPLDGPRTNWLRCASATMVRLYLNGKGLCLSTCELSNLKCGDFRDFQVS